MRLLVRLMSAGATSAGTAAAAAGRQPLAQPNPALASKLAEYCQFNPTPISMKTFADFNVHADERRSFIFLRKELPVRLANIMQELFALPNEFLGMRSVNVVSGWYSQSFTDLLRFEDAEPQPDTLRKYTDLLANVYERHSTVVETMADGVMEMKARSGVDPLIDDQLQYFLDRFYMMRICLRMLINQHLLLFKSDYEKASHKRIGSIEQHCDVPRIVEDAFESARFLCERYYLAAPNLRLELMDAQNPHASTINIAYVPSHLYHIIFEIFKNAMRATIEYHLGGGGTTAADKKARSEKQAHAAKLFDTSSKDASAAKKRVPDVNVLICKAHDDLTVKISDRGGGFSRAVRDLVFKYSYTTATHPSAGGSEEAPLAGYGYGLPLSRLYARYFGGDLVLSSVEGFGTDANIYLKCDATQASEVIPVFNRTAQSHYERSGIQVGDYCTADGHAASSAGHSPSQHSPTRRT